MEQVALWTPPPQRAGSSPSRLQRSEPSAQHCTIYPGFLDSFPLYEKAPTQAVRKLQKMLVVASGQTPPCPGVSPSAGQETAGPAWGKHRREPLTSWMSGTLD